MAEQLTMARGELLRLLRGSFDNGTWGTLTLLRGNFDNGTWGTLTIASWQL